MSIKNYKPPFLQESVDFSIDIANRIFDILEMKGMKQKDFAKLLGKSEAEISKWLKGTHNFNIDTILKIQAKLEEDIIQVTGKAKKEKGTIHIPKIVRGVPIKSQLKQ